MEKEKTKVILLIPCYNEEITVQGVINEFKGAISNEYELITYVYDNNSTDDTAYLADQAGAIVVKSPVQGKGAVVKHMFNDILSNNTMDADCYIMVDGDMTYPAKAVNSLIKAVVNEKFDMAIGDRLSSNYYDNNTRAFHGIGNTLVRFLVNTMFKGSITDIMTGYRVFSKDYIKKIGPQLKSVGFQIETELTIRTLKSQLKVKAIPIEYRDRPQGSVSKLSTVKDGIKVILMIFKLKFER